MKIGAARSVIGEKTGAGWEMWQDLLFPPQSLPLLIQKSQNTLEKSQTEKCDKICCFPPESFTLLILKICHGWKNHSIQSSPLLRRIYLLSQSLRHWGRREVNIGERSLGDARPMWEEFHPSSAFPQTLSAGKTCHGIRQLCFQHIFSTVSAIIVPWI